jgi:hypothetical protein
MLLVSGFNLTFLSVSVPIILLHMYSSGFVIYTILNSMVWQNIMLFSFGQ